MNGAAINVGERPIVMIGVPCGDLVHAEMANCLWGLARGSNMRARQGLAMGHSSIIANSRNNLVEALFQVKGEYLFQIDSDMVFPPDTLDRLLAHGKDIVGGTYVRRGPPFDNLGEAVFADRAKTTGLVEMNYIPTGMLLIRKRVFEALDKPYFRYGLKETPNGVVNKGEDMEFCERARAAGFQIFCDLDLSMELRHIYTYMLSPMDPSTRAVAENFKQAANG